MRRIAPTILATLSGISMLAACRDVTPPDAQLNYGFLTIDITGTPGNYTTDPSAIFIKSNPLTLGRLGTGEEGCDLSVYSSGGVDPTLNYIGAGGSVSVTINGTTVLLVPVTDDNLNVEYVRASGNALSLTPGDQFQLDVPGKDGGFPAMSLVGQTAAAITPDAITVPDSGADLNVNWTTTQAGSLIVYDLKYKASSTSADIDRELFCVFSDDGGGSIPADIVDGWRRSIQREAEVSRYTVVSTQLDKSHLYGSSQFVTIPTIVGP